MRKLLPNWVGDHYEQTSGQFASTLPDCGFYFWFGFDWNYDLDAMMFMGCEL